MKRRILALFVASVAGLTVGADTTKADDAQSAQFLRERGQQLIAARRTEDALMLLLEANRIAPDAQATLELAELAVRLRQYPLAWSLTEDYVAMNGERLAEALQLQANVRRHVGLLAVHTTPPGAAVHIDQVSEQGFVGASPRQIAFPGSTQPIRVILTLEGHHPVERELTIQTGDHRILRVELEPQTGQLHLDGDSQGDPVEIVNSANEVVTRLQPNQRRELPVGQYRARLGAESRHIAEPVPFEVRADETVRPQILATRRPPPTGHLLVRTSPPGDVYLDGRLLGTSPVSLRNVVVGRRTVEVRDEGRVRLRRSIAITEDVPTFLDVDLAEVR